MNIVFVASEGVLFSKTCGWADVVGASPRALATLAIKSVSICRVTARRSSAIRQSAARSVTVPFDDEHRFASVVSGGSQAGVRLTSSNIRIF